VPPSGGAVLLFSPKKTDSKGGSWQQSGGLLQPPWLFRRKASPFGVANENHRQFGDGFCFEGKNGNHKDEKSLIHKNLGGVRLPYPAPTKNATPEGVAFFVRIKKGVEPI